MRDQVQYRELSLSPAVVAGLCAGALMALAAMIHSAATGMGFWMPTRLIAAFWFGVTALVGGPFAIVAGLVTHLLMSIVFSVMFSAMLSRCETVASATLWGLLYGVAVWAFMSFLVLYADPVMRDRMLGSTPNWWFGYHLIFGGALGMTPALQHAFARRRLAVRATLPVEGRSWLGPRSPVHP